MPYKEKEIHKVYWSIGEVAKMVHRATSAIRYWELEFYWIKVKKNKKGERYFTRDNVNQIIQVNHALNFVGMTTEGVKMAYNMGYLDSLFKFVSDHQRNYQSPEKVKISNFT